MPAPSIRPRRSFIFTPGLRPEMFPKALATGADIVCVELEDGIAPKDKAAARANAMKLFESPQADDGVERIVRINSLREGFGIADVQAVLATDTPPPALMMPKVRTPDEVAMLDNLLTERGHDTRLHVIIETNAGLEAACDIAHCSPRIDAMFFGGVDMAAELRCRNEWEPLLYARSRVVHAAASAGLDVIDVPYLDLEDLDGMKRAAIQARGSGLFREGRGAPQANRSAQRGVHTLGRPDCASPAHHRRVRGSRYRAGGHRRQAHREAGSSRDAPDRGPSPPASPLRTRECKQRIGRGDCPGSRGDGAEAQQGFQAHLTGYDEVHRVRGEAAPDWGSDVVGPPSGCRFHPHCPRAEAICRTEKPAFRAHARPPSRLLKNSKVPILFCRIAGTNENRIWNERESSAGSE